MEKQKKPGKAKAKADNRRPAEPSTPPSWWILAAIPSAARGARPKPTAKAKAATGTPVTPVPAIGPLERKSRSQR